MCRSPPYDSMRNVQEALGELLNGQKTAGRRLGMMLEILTFLFFQHNGFGTSLRKGNQLESFAIDTTHETDFSFHPIVRTTNVEFTQEDNTIGMIYRPVPSNSFNIVENLEEIDPDGAIRSMKDKIVKSQRVNPLAVIATQEGERKDSGDPSGQKICSSITRISDVTGNNLELSISLLENSAFARVECKRVGIELSADTAPQTIEKAKQGSYAADHASSYQSFFSREGQKLGIIFEEDMEISVDDYQVLRQRIIGGEIPGALEGFCSTIFVFSEPDNWRDSSGEWKKDMSVLGSSFDWVMYLRDREFIRFCETFHLADEDENNCVREWIFQNSKLESIPWETYNQLMRYVEDNSPDDWFEIYTPEDFSPNDLVEELRELQDTISALTE